ncbi:unnamed protein product [Acanthoscelides obtectus]|uniref:Uncharacterized protein n=1 Tax=Acanthoscelides obtectus TaxID=200917 RepID=A0A9P0PV28_ACAOB|nr:unnamed protein product [Acanthoscelides obtectus]CAK1624267.1 hypothetical protein AOBTE_LOCUS2456 [Acanthoscelides obtectus]
MIADIAIHHGNALRTLQQEKNDNVMYIKLLKNKEETASLSRQHFRIASIIATTCARYENPTFVNFYMDKDPVAIGISNCITGYLTMRSKLATVRIGEMEAAYLGPNFEIELFFEYAIKEYHLRNQQEEDEDTIAPRFRSVNIEAANNRKIRNSN